MIYGLGDGQATAPAPAPAPARTWIWLGLGLAVAAFALSRWWLPLVRNPAPRRRRRSKREREVQSCERQALKETRPATFRRKAEGVRALLDENPDLVQLLESECGPDCYTFKRWEEGGRRGPKPAGRADGRFDAFNERWSKKGKNKISNWLEGVYATVPSSRHWDDFEGRTVVLEEATGRTVHLPERAERIRHGRQAAARCQDIDELEEAPF